MGRRQGCSAPGAEGLRLARRLRASAGQATCTPAARQPCRSPPDQGLQHLQVCVAVHVGPARGQQVRQAQWEGPRQRDVSARLQPHLEHLIENADHVRQDHLRAGSGVQDAGKNDETGVLAGQGGGTKPCSQERAAPPLLAWSAGHAPPTSCNLGWSGGSAPRRPGHVAARWLCPPAASGRGSKGEGQPYKASGHIAATANPRLPGGHPTTTRQQQAHTQQAHTHPPDAAHQSPPVQPAGPPGALGPPPDARGTCGWWAGGQGAPPAPHAAAAWRSGGRRGALSPGHPCLPCWRPPRPAHAAAAAPAPPCLAPAPRCRSRCRRCRCWCGAGCRGAAARRGPRASPLLRAGAALRKRCGRRGRDSLGLGPGTGWGRLQARPPPPPPLPAALYLGPQRGRGTAATGRSTAASAGGKVRVRRVSAVQP